jgi:hypothetical protein
MMASEAVALAPERAPTTGVPDDVLQALLREHLADPAAVITDIAGAPFPHQGTNDSTTFWRVTFNWISSNRFQGSHTGSHTSTWIIKHWKAGGLRDGALGITRTREVLVWEQGWLRDAALPAGIVVPFVSALNSADNTEAWLAMADVSTELSTYTRLGLSGEQVISRVKAILARLAYFHVLWEQPERQAELQVCPWLAHPESFLWEMAPTYAHALGRTPSPHMPPSVSGLPVWDGLNADLDAFLQARPADERRLWEQLLIDRQALVEGLAPYPQTLLHNDLDDRNMGLRWSNGAMESPDLVLIDWEWLALGPAVLDVAKIVLMLPVMIAPGNPIPQAIWSDEFAGHYFKHYRAAGGRCVDAAAWRRAYGLALVAQGVIQMPSMHGRLRRTIRGELPPPQIVGVPEAVIRQNLRDGLPMMEQMEKRVLREVRRWLSVP